MTLEIYVKIETKRAQWASIKSQTLCLPIIFSTKSVPKESKIELQKAKSFSFQKKFSD